MAITSYELMRVQGDYLTVDMIVWRRYRNRASGILEATLEANPHLASLHKTSPFLPIGTPVRIPIDLDILKGSPRQKVITLWET